MNRIGCVLPWPGLLLATCLICGCATDSAAPNTGKPASAAAINQTEAFARLNRISEQAKQLQNPVAVYMLYLKNIVHSSGFMRNLLAQVIAAQESELGNYTQAVQDYPQGAPQLTHSAQPLPDTSTARAEPAAEIIANLARSRRIVMLNEAHHAAQTRLLTLQLLPRLRKLGFNYFAAEALDEKDRDLQSRGYPVHDSGTYVREPIYAELIRSAIRLGYHVVAYDTTRLDSDPAQREQDQADHLRRRVFDRDPGARLFVHAGYAHVDKRADYFYTDTLAMRLKHDTGFNPLTIDQTLLREMAPGLEYAGYRTLVQRFDPHGPTVLVMRSSGAAWSLEPEIYDVSVLLPPTRLLDGRPSWLTLGGQRRPVSVAENLPRLGLPFLIEARYADESADAVPADREMIVTDKPPPPLFLRPGDYRLDVLGAKGRRRPLRRLHVPAGPALGSG